MKDPLDERYHRDPSFAALVDTMYNAIHAHQFSPTEIREAAMYAVIKYDMRNPRPMMFKVNEHGWLVGIDYSER